MNEIKYAIVVSPSREALDDTLAPYSSDAAIAKAAGSNSIRVALVSFDEEEALRNAWGGNSGLSFEDFVEITTPYVVSNDEIFYEYNANAHFEWWKATDYLATENGARKIPGITKRELVASVPDSLNDAPELTAIVMSGHWYYFDVPHSAADVVRYISTFANKIPGDCVLTIVQYMPTK